MITLYGMSSPNVRKVILMLEETALPYNIQYVDVFGGEQFSKSIRELNPNAKVPILIDSDGPDGELTLFESGAILNYLAEKTQQFLPETAHERHLVMQWLMFQMANIGPIFGQALHFQHLAPDGNDYGRARYGAEAVRLHEVLDEQLSRSTFVAGAEYSIADISLAPWLALYAKLAGLDLNNYSALSRWLNEIKARPAYLRMNEVAAGLSKRDSDNRSHAPSDALDRYYRRGRWGINQF